MKRRDFITLAGVAAAAVWPLAARAQQAGGIRRVSLLMLYPEKDPQGELRATVFRRAIEKAGWKVGGNLQINFHWGTGDADWVRSAAAQILSEAPDVMLATAMRRSKPRSKPPEPSPSFSSPVAIPSAMAWWRAWRIPAAI